MSRWAPRGPGWFRNNNDASAFHGGTDFKKESKFSGGDNKVFDVLAAADGMVDAKLKNCIILLHTTAKGKKFRTVYQDVDKNTMLHLVPTDNVLRGEKLGKVVGGKNAHLHFGVAVQLPSFTYGGNTIPAFWHFIDPWGFYDFVDENNYKLENGGFSKSSTSEEVHTRQWEDS